MLPVKFADLYARLEGARRFHLALKSLPIVGAGVLPLERGILRLLEILRGLRTPPGDHPLARLILLLGLHERATAAYLAERLRPGMRVVDVGAHVGYHTKRFARLVGEGGLVLAFEPNPSTFCLLQANLRGKENVRLFNVAVTDRPGLYRLVVPTSSSQALRVALRRGETPFSVEKGDEEGGSEGYALGMPLGDFLDAFAGDASIDLLKIDAEGAEVRILRSLKPWANRIEEILCEVNPSVLTAQGETPEGLLEALEHLGFSRFAIIDGVIGKGNDPEPPELPSGWIGRREVEAFLRFFPPDAEGWVNLAARR